MSHFEETISKACRERTIPGAVLVAGSPNGNFRYQKAFGVRSLVSNEPLAIDATMWIASCTKLMTTVAAMQCVERGLLNLDEDVITILPELKDLPILKGFDAKTGGTPILINNTKPITLRHLLTHSSGISYDVFNPMLMKYLKMQRKIIAMGGDLLIKDKYAFPLLFAPGDGWEYGVGIDWAGQMVERVNNNISLEEYLERNVWKPLAIENITFKPNQHSGVKSRLTDISWREGGVTAFGTTDNPNGKVEPTDKDFWDANSLDCHGGAGLFGDMPGYSKLLQSILDSNTCKILKKTTIDEMFRPQLSQASKLQLAQLRSIEALNDTFGAIDSDVEADWGLGGIMNLKNLRSGRKAGSLSWGGYPNLMWWIDRSGGLAGIYGSQVCPPGDPASIKLNAAWEKDMYERMRRAERGRL